MSLLNTKIISKPIEDVLKAVYLYRYITAQDVAHLLYSPGSITYVRDILAGLCGRADYKPNQYLYRFPFPPIATEKTEKVYTLGALGRDYLKSELGLPVDWYFKPQKTRHFGFGFLSHALTLTRVLVAAHFFVRKHPDFSISRFFTSYELEREGLKTASTVIPDAWILFDEVRDNRHRKTPLFLEIDRGTEHKQQFKKFLKARLEFIQSGRYEQVFETQAVMIAYATTGQLPEYRETRRRLMQRWVLDVLEELNMEEWAGIFRLAGINWRTLYATSFFTEPVWYIPGKDKPVSLFGG